MISIPLDSLEDIINITPKGEVSVGNTSIGNYEVYNTTVCTAKLNDQNKFYLSIPDMRGGNPKIVEQTYDTNNDIVVWNPNLVELPINIYITDMFTSNIKFVIKIPKDIGYNFEDGITEDVEQLKEELLESSNAMLIFLSENTDFKSIHPFFGELTAEQWLLFQKKHFTHHLSQFNLL